MKKTFAKSGVLLALALFVLTAVVPVTTYAQTDNKVANPPSAQASAQLQAQVQKQAQQVACAADPAGCAATNIGSAVVGAASTYLQCQGDFTCSFLHGVVSILSNISYYIMSGAAYFLGIVGVLFDWLVVITIFQFGAYFGNSQGLLDAWSVLRDIANIMILFGFLYAGIAMILDLHSFDARKAIPRLIIFAVLLNFSLFAAEAIVDLANVVSAQLYLQAGSTTLSSCVQSLKGCGLSGDGQIGIASVLIQDSYIGSAFSYNPTTGGDLSFVQLPHPDDVKTLLAYMGTTALMVVLMIVLLIAAIMLVIRSVALVVLLVVSPLGFAGMAIPALEKRAQQWWHSLISNAIFAPIFLLLVFVGLKIIDGLRGAMTGYAAANSTVGNNLLGQGAGGTSASLASALTSPGTSIGSIFIIYSLVIGFFVAALIFSKSSSAAGAQFTTNFVTKTLRQTASSSAKVVTLPARVGVRQGVGWAAEKGLSQYNRTLGTMQEKGGLSAGVVKGLRWTGADEGVQTVLNKGQDVKVGLRRSYREEQAFSKKRVSGLEHEGHQVQSEQALVAALTVPKSDPRYQKVLADAQRVLLESSIQDVKNIVERFKKDPRGADLQKFVAAEMTPDKFAKLLDDEHLDHELKHNLIEGRYGQMHQLKQDLDAAAAGAAKEAAFKDLRDHLRSWTQKDFETALLNDSSSADTFAIVSPDGKGNSVIPSGEIRKSLAKNTSIPRVIRLKLNENSKENLLKDAMHRNDATAIRNLMAGSNMTEEVAEIGDDRIIDASGRLTPAGVEFVKNLDTTRKLKAIVDKKDGLSDPALHAIADFVQSRGAPAQKQLFKKFLTGNNSTLWAGRTIT